MEERKDGEEERGRVGDEGCRKGRRDGIRKKREKEGEEQRLYENEKIC
jgi:hypothetical protein